MTKTYIHEIADQVATLVGDTTGTERCIALRELLRLFRGSPIGPQCQDAAAEAALFALENRKR